MVKKLHNFTIQEYANLKNTGLLWELFPEATGNFLDDVETSFNNEFRIEND